MKPPRCLHRALLVTALVWSAALLHASPVEACSCARAPDAKTALAGAQIVFEGRVVQDNLENEQAAQPAPALPDSPSHDLLEATEARNPQRLYRFEVLHRWKGETANLVTIETPSQGAACGRTYKRDTTYLIYAYAGAEGRLSDNLCTRSASIAQAREDLEALKSLQATHAARANTPDAPKRQEGQAEPATAQDQVASEEPLHKHPGCALAEQDRFTASTYSLLILALAACTLTRRRTK